MRAVDRTTRRFIDAVKAAIPAARVCLSRSVTDHGRSNYVTICDDAGNRSWSVRISDHPVGMRRAMSGQHQMFMHARATPDSWSVWLGQLVRKFQRTAV